VYPCSQAGSLVVSPGGFLTFADLTIYKEVLDRETVPQQLEEAQKKLTYIRDWK
jgi:hypothetical protein